MAEHITSSGIRLHYQDHGDPQAPVVILIMGLGAQMTVWPEPFIEYLVKQRFRVIRFDNRDVGLSSKLDDHGQPNLITQALKQKFKLQSNPPYTLDDMAQDVIDLMDGLKIPKAHIVGASMGGMIAQIIAAKFRKRCKSLTSMMSTTGNPKLPKANLKVMWQLVTNRRGNKNEEAAIEQTVKLNRILGSPEYPMDELELRRLAEQNIKRSYHPSGFKRQLAAITSAGNRIPLLQRIKVPTLIIHGSDDPLIPVQAGLDTAIHINKSKIRIIRGMGHNIPLSLCEPLAKMIFKHARKTEMKLALKAYKSRRNDTPTKSDTSQKDESTSIEETLECLPSKQMGNGQRLQ